MGLRARSGKWHYRLWVDGNEFNGSTGLAATEKNREAALLKLGKIREDIQNGKENQVKIKAIPFIEARKQFLAWAKAEHRESPETYKDARSKTAAAEAYFGRRPVHMIRSGDIENFKTWRRNGDEEQEIAPIAEITLRHNLHQLSKFWQYAIRQGWARINPLKGVTVPSDVDAVRMYILTTVEEKRYFRMAAVRSEVLHDIGRLMIRQGMRPQEAASIQKKDVDLLAGELTVRGRLTRAGKRRTKTVAGKRVLPIAKESRDILTKWLGRSVESPWLFPSERKRGNPVGRLNNAHNEVLEKTGLDFVMYDFRHTFATRAAVKMPLSTLANLLGHKDLKTIMKYVHPQRNHLRDGMRAMDDDAESASGFCPVDGEKGPKKPRNASNSPKSPTKGERPQP